MAKRISKRVREEAALACAVAACEQDFGLALVQVVRCLFGERDDVWQLAYAAKNHAGAARRSYTLACAEAEALLRTGWTP